MTIQKTSVPDFQGRALPLADVRFVFLFCPNHSGTTVLSQYLASQMSGYLPPFGNNEGQMVPALKPMMREQPWNKDQVYDWDHIRACWETLAAGRAFILSLIHI